MLLEWIPRLCLRFVLHDMRLFIIYHCHVWCHELFVAYLVAFYAKLNEILIIEFHILRWKFLSV